MTKSEQYKLEIQAAVDLETYLKQNSCLPGPRSNLELLYVAADLCNEADLRKWLALSPEQAPENTPEVFLQLIGVVGLGRLILEHGQPEDTRRLREFANDDRWRVREGVAMALQQIGFKDAQLLAEITRPWLDGSLHELRAVAAAWAEPGLLKMAFSQNTALECMDQITRNFQQSTSTDKEARRILKKGLEYAWSVVVAANLELGKPFFEKWFHADQAIRKIMLVNLTKNRLIKADPVWVDTLIAQAGKEVDHD
jgi:hypothetical protein